MKILIFGVGGVGGFLGSRITNKEFDVSYVARGKRFEFLKKEGLKISSQLGDKKIKNIKVFDSIPSDKKFDIIICTVKLYDFDNFILDLKNVGINNSIILPFQNGIYSEQKVIEEFGKTNAFGAVAQISSYVDENQIIKHNGKLATFFVGHMFNKEDDRLNDFCNKCKNSGLDLRLKQNIKEKIWEKFIFLSAYSGITTLTKKTIGEIFETPKLKNNFINAMQETYSLSKFFQVEFKSDPVEYWLEKITKMPFDMTSSMYIDFINKKKLELNWLSGFIVKYSKKFGNNCQTHKEILDGITSK